MAINASTVKTIRKPSNTPILAVGNYSARLAQVIDLGVQKRRAWKGEEKPDVRQVWVTYEIPTEFMLDDDGNEDKDKPRWISEKMNLFSLDQDKAISTQRINGLDPASALNGDWLQATGLPCTLTVVHSKCGKYANIGAVSPVMKGMEVGELANPAATFDTEEPDAKVFDGLPDFLKDMIKAGVGYSPIAAPDVAKEEDDGGAPY